jgi:glycosyltransferase involved in cell wall biosynthesis
MGRVVGRPYTVAAVAFDHHQGRTQAIANEFGGRAWYFRSRPTQKILLPVRYVVDAARMWRMLRDTRPDVLIVITPPVVAPLVAWCWCATHPCRLVIDCHTSSFYSWRWRWSLPVLKLVCKTAVAALVHTLEDLDRVGGWGVRALLFPDEVPDVSQARPQPPAARPTVVVAGSLDPFEPIEATLDAARLLPDVELRFTGYPHRVPEAARRAAPANAVFTGWLDYPRFLGELLAAHAVAVFSTDPHIMNRAAFEAIGLGRPLVLSDIPGLRGRFGQAALFSANEPAAMAAAIRRAIEQRDELAATSTQLQSTLRAQHRDAVVQLAAMLEAPHQVSLEATT